MNHEQLAALEDVTDAFATSLSHADGRTIVTPRLMRESGALSRSPREGGALFQAEDDGDFVDAVGTTWTTGWLDGKHVKRRRFTEPAPATGLAEWIRFDDTNDVVIVDGVRIAAELLRTLTRPSRPGAWFRIAARRGAVVEVEQRFDSATAAEHPYPLPLMSVQEHGLPADDVLCWVFSPNRQSSSGAWWPPSLAAPFTNAEGTRYWSARDHWLERGAVYDVTHYFVLPTDPGIPAPPL